MGTDYRKISTPFYIGISFLLCSIAIELLFILLLNNGFFVYTLDDPYIHMALAENIKKWHYGININEFSAPSSSILWPFILMPFSDYEYAPFIINIAAAIGTVFFIIKVLFVSIGIQNYRINNIIISTSAIFFILATNIIGLPFTGMEHSLQVLMVSLVAYGMIMEREKEELPLWVLAAIIFAPLIRYECLAISIAAVMYLWLRGYFKQAVFVVALLFLFLIFFSIFLFSLGLGFLPTSVLAKSSLLSSGKAMNSVLENINCSLNLRQGIIISFGALVFLLYLFFTHDTRKKHLVLVTIIALSMHVIAGRYGGYHRYEIYILVFLLLISIYIFSPSIKNFIKKKTSYSVQLLFVYASFTAFVGKPYIIGLVSLPLASNNIYEQQYQMHRFAVEYYNKSVAVNDLGFVSYKNNNYVLDLIGLGSKKVFEYRTNGNGNDWMKKVCEETNIGLIMSYEHCLGKIPDTWIKIGKLRLGKKQITPAGCEVVFYATSKEAFLEIVVALDQFIKTLPNGVKFIYDESEKKTSS